MLVVDSSSANIKQLVSSHNTAVLGAAVMSASNSTIIVDGMAVSAIGVDQTR